MLRIQDTKTNKITELDDTTIDEMIHALNWVRRERERCRIKDAKRNTGRPVGRPRKISPSGESLKPGE